MLLPNALACAWLCSIATFSPRYHQETIHFFMVKQHSPLHHRKHNCTLHLCTLHWAPLPHPPPPTHPPSHHPPSTSTPLTLPSPPCPKSSSPSLPLRSWACSWALGSGQLRGRCAATGAPTSRLMCSCWSWTWSAPHTGALRDHMLWNLVSMHNVITCLGHIVEQQGLVPQCG